MEFRPHRQRPTALPPLLPGEGYYLANYYLNVIYQKSTVNRQLSTVN